MILVTFSGLDGSGKSTQVDYAGATLEARGYRVYRLRTLLTSVTGAATLIREVRKTRRRRNAPASAPVVPTSPQRTYAGGRSYDQDRRRRFVQLRRSCVYPLDCLALTAWLGWLRIRGYQAVVCDRYIYDKMVNLPRPDGLLARIMRWLTPTPTCAVYLDVDLEAAEQRRGHEHTPDYFRTKAEAYNRVCSANPKLHPIAPSTIEETRRRIEAAIFANAGLPDAPAVAHAR